MKRAEERTVAVLGASENPDRYSNKAMKRLLEKGFRAIPVNPTLRELYGTEAAASLAAITGEVDTITVYLSPERSTPLADQIIARKPSRVVFNPGAENPELEHRLDLASIPWIRACTLVLLSTGAF